MTADEKRDLERLVRGDATRAELEAIIDRAGTVLLDEIAKIKGEIARLKAGRHG